MAATNHKRMAMSGKQAAVHGPNGTQVLESFFLRAGVTPPLALASMGLDGGRHQARAVRRLRGVAMLLASALVSTVALAQTQAQKPAATPSVSAAARNTAPVALAVRSQQALAVEGVPVRVLVANPEVADVQILSPSGAGRAGAVMLIGRKPGSTTVQVWLRGQTEPVVTRVSVTGGLQAALPPTPGFGVSMQDDSAVLVGEAPSLLAHQAAVGAATDAVGAAKVQDLSTVGPGGMVQVDVKVVEMSRNVLKDVGISIGANNTRGGFQFGLANTAPTASGAWNLTTNLVRGAFNLDVAVNLLQTNGLARVLAEPTLLAMSGQSASFLAGGEIPIPTSGGLGTQNVEYKPFGIGLTLTPTVLASDRIALKVAPEASELDWANAIPVATGDNSTLFPALRTRRADTTVELGDGESFVIGGLVSRTTLASVNKLPFLGDLPIIGALFRNMRYSQEEKELVIVVTPHLVRPIARGATLPLPGQREERRDSAGNAWGHFVLGIASGDQMPGFSR